MQQKSRIKKSCYEKHTKESKINGWNQFGDKDFAKKKEEKRIVYEVHSENEDQPVFLATGPIKPTESFIHLKFKQFGANFVFLTIS